jgi:broad specificity phosphatase PhoE
MTLMHRRQGLRALLTLGAGLALPGGVTAQSVGRTDFWALLHQGGCVVLMRHALTEPGVGDPPGWRLENCNSQRRLSDAGREQARRVAAAFQREQVRVDEVRSSAWCRCTETADLAFGRHTVWAPLNSFFQTGSSAAQTRALNTGLQAWSAPRNLVLVTHQVNISALSGAYPAMGELFVIRPALGQEAPWPVLARWVA